MEQGADDRRADMAHEAQIGRPLVRREAIAKVTGVAEFAADRHPPGLLHAVIVGSTIARGRVLSLDLERGRAHPGVVEIMTSANAPALALDPAKAAPPQAKLMVLQDDLVRFANQPIAVAIAETLESAQQAASILSPRYAAETCGTGLDCGPAFVPDVVGEGQPARAVKGDVAEQLRLSHATLCATYETSPQFHNPMEPHAVVANWCDGKLVVDTPTQAIAIAQRRIAELFGLRPEDVLVRSPFIGGGFGSKGIMWAPQILAVMAARLVGRPVKLVLAREQMYGPVGHRAPTRQRVELGVGVDHRLTAISHRSRTTTSRFDTFIEPSSAISQVVYASEAIETAHEAVRVDTGTPRFMRAPGEGPGSAALESAIDEMAWQCRSDPLAFRLANHADVEPISGKPFSSKSLKECYSRAADRFGWSSRRLEPRTTRDESGLLVGWGVGTASYPAWMVPSQARVALVSDGSAIVELSAQEMGQGAATVLPQIAAEALALDTEQVQMKSGRSDLPDAGPANGSGHTASAGTAIAEAARAVIAKLGDLASNDPASPLFGSGNVGVLARDGRLHRRDEPSRSESYIDILKRAGLQSLQAEGACKPDHFIGSPVAMHAHGAVFAEVKVHPTLCQVRVTRLVGAFACGRIVNPRLAESQCIGGMIWGLSFALHERAVYDARSGRPMNANFAEYLIPVSADAPSVEAILVEEVDRHVNALGVKGIGEIGVTGTAGAIANAIWHATGVRVREFPVRLERLILKHGETEASRLERWGARP